MAQRRISSLMTTTLSFLLYSRPKPHTWYMPRDPQVFLLTISLPFSQYSTPALFSATTRTTWDRFSCVTFSNLRHPRDFTSHTSRKGILYIYIYINVFFWPFSIFFSSGRGSFLVLSAPWNAGSPPGPRTQVWALAEVRGTSSGGSKSQVRSGQ